MKKNNKNEEQSIEIQKKKSKREGTTNGYLNEFHCGMTIQTDKDLFKNE